MAELSVGDDEIYRIYRDLIEDISIREEKHRDEIPIEGTAELPTHLDDIVNDWETGRKSLRTVPVANVYAEEFERSLEESVLRTLTGLDATVNVLDDIIDSQSPTPESRVRLTVNAAFSSVLVAENLPTENRDQANDLLRQYFTALFQIPLVERRLFDEMKAVASDPEREAAAVKSYSYRARDIDIFARLPAISSGVEPDIEQRLVQDLRTYRARRLLFKDIYDVPRDLSDGDITPIIHVLRNGRSVDETVETIERIYAEFEYTNKGIQQYGSILKHLEGIPSDINTLLQGAKRTVMKYSD